MLPLTEVGKVAQDDVSDECYPDLPFHSPLIVSHEVAELQALLELFEEDFNCPAAFVEIADAAGRELHVVRGELTWVILEPITDVIEAQSSGHLTIDEGDEMAPGRERSRLLLASVLAGQLGNETCRDVLANGIENGVSILWLGAMWRLFH